MDEILQMDILEIAKALMTLPQQEQQVILNRAYGMCMYALTVSKKSDCTKSA